MANITCNIEHSFDNLEGLRDVWDQLVIEENGGFYISYDWCRIWWKHYEFGRKLRIYTFYDRKDLVGIVPMFIDCVWLGPVWLRIAKIIGYDYTRKVCNLPIRKKWSEKILETVTKSLINDDNCDAILYSPLFDESENVKTLLDVSKRLKKITIAHNKIIGQITISKLPASFDDYLKSLSQNERKEYRQGIRRLSKSYDVIFDIITEENLADQEFNRFISMHSEQWQLIGKPGHFGAWPLSINFHFDLLRPQARLKRLRLIRLLANNQVVAYQYLYAFGDCYYAFLTARACGTEWDKYGLGRILYGKTVECAIKEGFYRINIGEFYKYKVRLGGEVDDIRSILVVSGRICARIRCFIFSFLSNALNIVYHKIWIARLLPRLGQRKGPFWKTWIRSNM